MMDKIKISYVASVKLQEAINKFTEYISDETLAVELVNEEVKNMTKDKLNGENIEYFVSKVND